MTSNEIINHEVGFVSFASLLILILKGDYKTKKEHRARDIILMMEHSD